MMKGDIIKYIILKNMKKEKKDDIIKKKLLHSRKWLSDLGFYDNEIKNILRGIEKNITEISKEIFFSKLIKAGYIEKNNNKYEKNKLLIKAEVIEYLNITNNELNLLIKKNKLTNFEKLTKNRCFLLREVEKIKEEMNLENNKYYSFKQFRNKVNKITIKEIFDKYNIKQWKFEQIKKTLLEEKIPYEYKEYLNFNKRKAIKVLLEKKILKYDNKGIRENELVDKNYIFQKMCIKSIEFLSNLNKYLLKEKTIIMNKYYYEKEIVDNLFFDDLKLTEYLELYTAYKIYKKYFKESFIKNKYELIYWTGAKIQNNIIFIEKRRLYRIIKNFSSRNKKNLINLENEKELKIISKNDNNRKSKKAYLRRIINSQGNKELKIISKNNNNGKSKKTYLRKIINSQGNKELKIISKNDKNEKSKNVYLRKTLSSRENKEIVVRIKNYDFRKIMILEKLNLNKYYMVKKLLIELNICFSSIWKLQMIDSNKYKYYKDEIYVEKEYINKVIEFGIDQYILESTMNIEEIEEKFNIEKKKIRQLIKFLDKKTDIIDDRIIKKKLNENKIISNILYKKIIKLKNIKIFLGITEEKLKGLLHEASVCPSNVLNSRYVTEKESQNIYKIYEKYTITITEFCHLSDFTYQTIRRICEENGIGIILRNEEIFLDRKNYYKLNKLLKNIGVEVTLQSIKKSHLNRNEIYKLEKMGIKNIFIHRFNSKFNESYLKKIIIQEEIRIYIKLRAINGLKVRMKNRKINLNKKIYKNPILMYLYRKNNNKLFNCKEQKYLLQIINILDELTKYIKIRSNCFKVESTRKIFIKKEYIKKYVTREIGLKNKKYLIEDVLQILKKQERQKMDILYNVKNLKEISEGYSFKDILSICSLNGIKIIEKEEQYLINKEEYIKFRELTEGVTCRYILCKKYNISPGRMDKYIKNKFLNIFFKGNRVYIKEVEIKNLLKKIQEESRELTINERIHKAISELELSECEKIFVKDYFIVSINRSKTDRKRILKINKITRTIKLLKKENILKETIDKINLSKFLKWSSIPPSTIKEISIFLNYLESKKITDTKILIKTKSNKKGEIYTEKIWKAYYKYLLDISRHIEKAINKREYACAWLKAVFNITSFIRSREIYSLPNIDIEIIEETIDEIKKNSGLSYKSAKLLEENLYYKIKEMKINKNNEKIIILIPEGLEKIIMTIYYIVEMHRRNGDKYKNISEFESIFTPYTSIRPIKKIYMNELFKDYEYGDDIETLKSNRSFASYGNEFIVKNKIKSKGALEVMRVARGHKNKNTTAIYIKNSNIDISKSLFESEHFGWMYNIIIETICGENIEDNNKIIRILSDKVKPKQLECIAKYQLNRDNKKKLIVEQILSLSKSEMKKMLDNLNNEEYRAKQRGISCIQKNKRICNLKENCIMCDLAIFKKEIFYSIENYIENIIKKLNSCGEWEISMRSKYSMMLFRCLEILNYGTIKYGKKLINEYIDIDKLRKKVENVKNLLMEEVR